MQIFVSEENAGPAFHWVGHASQNQTCHNILDTTPLQVAPEDVLLVGVMPQGKRRLFSTSLHTHTTHQTFQPLLSKVLGLGA